MRVLLSRPPAPSGTEALGRTHYSYGFAARNFTRMLDEAGVEVTPVAGPERFKSAEYARSLGLDGPAHPHLIFRSTEDIRPIPGAWNIGCFAWEFEVLSGPGLPHGSRLAEQVTMLRLCDEIWAPCGFTRRVLERHGFDNVRVVPSPVFPPLAPRERARGAAWDSLSHLLACPLVSFSSNFVGDYDADLERDFHELERLHAGPLGAQARLRRVAAEGGGRVFVSVLNPYDRRKNLANMIDGFLLATQDREDAVLVIKLITSGEVERPAGYLFHQLRLILGRPHCLHTDRIVLVGGLLSDAEMGALYNGSDVYLCTSLAEGQNAPLLEAMRHRCLPVTTANTAMADYIDAQNAVVIAEGRYPTLVPELAGDVAGRPYEIDFAGRYEVADAVERALALSDAEVARKAQAAHAAVMARFSVEAVTPQAVGRLQEIAAALARGERPRPQPRV